jgi:hypothetical protein
MKNEYLDVQTILSMKRDKAMDIVNALPEEFDLETLIEKLVFIEKVEQGLTPLKTGHTLTHEKVKDITKKW